MGLRVFLIGYILIAVHLYICNGCTLEGVQWPVPVSLTIYDTHQGNILDRSTTGIEGINSFSVGGGLNAGPYLEIAFTDSRFSIWTNDAFQRYEENEVEDSMSITVNFRCIEQTTRAFVFWINVIDTNNNAPQFIPTDQLEFKIATPVPPGFLVTGCFNDIIVRDIDLTTQRIDFGIEDNPLFEIEYDASLSTTPKEFRAVLRTKTLIRTLAEPITLRISATDVDLTGDPPITTYGTVIVSSDEEFQFPDEPVFSEVFYLADYTDDHRLVHEPISLKQGYDDQVIFSFDGGYTDNFQLVRNGNQLSINLQSPLNATTLMEQHILLIVTAQREYTSGAATTIVVRLPQAIQIEFEMTHYNGRIVNNNLQLPNLILSRGYEDSFSVTVSSEYSSYFNAAVQGNTIIITMLPLTENIILENSFIYLQVLASTERSSATTVVTLEIIKDDFVTPTFNQAIYTGHYDSDIGLSIEQIYFTQGFDETVTVSLQGDYTDYFRIVQDGVNITIRSGEIPPELYSEQHLILSLEASKPRTVGANAAVIIYLPEDTPAESEIRFAKLLYEGAIQNNVVQHENIIISGFTGTNIQLYGEYASMFTSTLTDGIVLVEMLVSIDMPDEITLIALEMHAADAKAVLLLTVFTTGTPSTPNVEFSSTSYSLRLDITQTGLIGQVHAIADNGEALRYSVQTNNSHLAERISVNNGGELHLSAPANSGVYTFNIVATTVFTQTTATATVHMTVVATTTCGDDIVVPPLIVLERDEEEPYINLLVLDTTKHPNCRYSLSNRWPTDQSWLYVDDTGLHTRAIDREHGSIAFMALSQVQVELTLLCDDDRIRSKRSTVERPDWLGPYDYGTSNWILSDSISYNSRRSFVNLVVNDINDNAPVFIGKENEPIAVGYPVPDLEVNVMPRSLAELQATDADIGKNAALFYWTSEKEIVVAPSTGFVHVRNGSHLEQDSRLVVHATDRNGEGLTGSIELIVKLLDLNNILVVTVGDSFLDDENTILKELSNAVGYDVKALRSTVISQSMQSDEDDSSRKKRETGATGAYLQLYVYGLIEREPVSIDQLTADINNNVIIAVSVVNIVSLEDHLEGQEICVIPGRDTGLLVATIILSVLLFILIVLIVAWFTWKRIKNDNYEQFSDHNSLASRNESFGQSPQIDMVTKPRLNIEDLKKSERRLQDMLDAPLEEVKPHKSRADDPFESALDIPTIEPHAPIVIQSIDKLKDATDESEDDEFGEKSKTRRKSVVTFNENVEKIIHVEDNDDSSTDPGYEIYKL